MLYNWCLIHGLQSTQTHQNYLLPRLLPVPNSRCCGETEKTHNYRSYFPSCCFIFMAIQILRVCVLVDKCNFGVFVVYLLRISPVLLVVFIWLHVTCNKSRTADRTSIKFDLLKFVDTLHFVLKSGKNYSTLPHVERYSLNIYRS